MKKKHGNWLNDWLYMTGLWFIGRVDQRLQTELMVRWATSIDKFYER